MGHDQADMRVARKGLARRLQARQPVNTQTFKRSKRRQRHGGSLFIAQLAHFVPAWAQVKACIRYGTVDHRAESNTRNHVGIATFGMLQLHPSLTKLIGIACGIEPFKGQRTNEALTDPRSEGLMLRQQSGTPQRIQGLTAQPGSLQTQTHGVAAPCSARRQFAKQAQGAVRIAIFERPTDRLQTSSVALFSVKGLPERRVPLMLALDAVL